MARLSNTAGPSRILYTCVEPFAIPTGNGGWEAYPQGRQVFEGDAILRTHGHAFRLSSQMVEQATAGPGELRAVRVPEPPVLAPSVAPVPEEEPHNAQV